MNKPNDLPAHPNKAISDEVRDELLRRLETYDRDKASARPAREAIEALLKRAQPDVTP